ncbi:DUF4468 domain-containing protein [Bacteroides intestinalis]|uniref:DUF4468 domain-containing protein n=1 Tax=Bacteroides intestinalis TaxID=329854 RepID=A0A6N2XKE2_9BACE|nr:DUF4468 domain-containing protein [Bacteroides intestinalis]DAN80164.1 MAG TPA: hypothetical protein [Caudoviricetes sp.]
MKKILFLLALLPMFVIAQNNYIINDNGSLSFIKIMNSSINKSSGELFGNALAYLGTTYADANNVIQIKNDENKFIVAKGVFSDIFSWTNSMIGRKTFFEVPHTLRIDCKDGRIKVEYTIAQYTEIEGNWVHPENDQRIRETPILSKYPIASPKKSNKISKEEKRYKDAFENLTNIIELQFNEIQKSINTDESDW